MRQHPGSNNCVEVKDPYSADLFDAVALIFSMPRIGDDPVAQCARRRPHDRSFAANARAPAFAPNRNLRTRIREKEMATSPSSRSAA